MPQAVRESSKPARPLWVWGAVAVLLGAHALLALDTLRQKSVTVDEVGHLPAGISYWQKQTFALYHHNPPLVKLLAALPALAIRPAVEYSPIWREKLESDLPLSPWAFGWEFMYANQAKYHEIYFWARLPVVGLSLLAGLVVYLWARELFGEAAGLVGLSLWCFSPNTIAHAGLVTTDMGASAIGVLAMYGFWGYLRRPTWKRVIGAGLLLGLAQLTKFSLLLFYPLWTLLWLAWITLSSLSRIAQADAGPPATRFRSGGKGLIQLVVIFGGSLLVINLGYCFEGTGTRLGDYEFVSETLTRPRPPRLIAPVDPVHPWAEVLAKRQNRFRGTWLARLPVPLPRHYLAGFDEQRLESEGIEGKGYPVYLCGQLRRTGWWWYYLFALAVKVPLGTWLLTGAALWIASRQPGARADLKDELVLLAPPLALLLMMSFLTDIDLGLRYVLPGFAFWFVAVARVGRSITASARWGGIILAVGLLWNLAACRFHPDYLAYFNELVGGPDRGGQYLIDSNLDWGQDLLALERWLRENRPGESVGLAYFGNVDPSILSSVNGGFDFSLAPPRRLSDIELVAIGRESRLQELRQRRLEELLAESPGLDPQALFPQLSAASLWNQRGTRDEIFRLLELREGPQPGLYAISANFVFGLPFRLRDQEGNLWHARENCFSYFRELEPVKRVGYSIFLYDVSIEEANELRREMGLDLLWR